MPAGEYAASVELLGFGGEVTRADGPRDGEVEKGKLGFLVARSAGTTIYAAEAAPVAGSRPEVAEAASRGGPAGTSGPFSGRDHRGQRLDTHGDLGLNEGG